MKKGISLIVLVITIIVMIIIAGAIIISLNSSNVISQANTAVEKSDLANAQNAAMLAYAEAAVDNNGVAKKADGSDVDEQFYLDALTTAGFTAANYTVSVNEAGIPRVSLKGTSTASQG